ncbi:MAG TPA: TetR family transcriptional regulator, partial [Micrococcus luteus]|nr:TetR family transcriptional regulator [Micrococcus luteus]
MSTHAAARVAAPTRREQILREACLLYTS